MPRIELIDPNLKGGDDRHSTTVDVCSNCRSKFPDQQDALPADLANDIDETSLPDDFDLENAVIGSLDAEHPPYVGDEYDCQACGERLTFVDD